MPNIATPFARLLPLCVFAGTALAAGPGSERIVVRSEQDLPTVWRVANLAKDVDLLTLKGPRLRYGCINVAFLIEADGKVADSMRLLAYRTDSAQKENENVFNFIRDFMKDAISGYTPTPETTAPIATYTSRSIPIFSKKTEAELTPEQQAILKSALRKACAIDDLPSRLRDGPKQAVQLEALPSLEILLGSHPNPTPTAP
jgi:hypothetical protein